jgi:Yip1 domain
MTTTDPAPAPAPIVPQSLIARIQGILMTPAAEWDRIEPEPATVPGLFIGYAAILAAIPAVALIIQHLLFIHWGILWGIVVAVIDYVVTLVGVFILGFIIDALAPSFGAQRSLVQAMKLAIYPYTAYWIAGILNILPVLGALAGLAGLYGLYILWLGLPKLMKSPEDKTLGYFIVSIVVAAVVNGILFAVLGAISVMAAAGAIATSAAAYSANVNHSTLAQLQNVAAQVQANAANQPPPPGSVHAVPADTLKALLPATLSGLPRTDLSATTGAAAGISGSNAEGVYADTGGDKRITLSITDMAALGAVASLASTMNVESDHETATGYDKVSKIGGRMTEEQFDNQSKTGKYSVLVANRFMVDAEGSGVAIDDLKAAVNAVGFDKLEGMAHA